MSMVRATSEDTHLPNLREPYRARTPWGLYFFGWNPFTRDRVIIRKWLGLMHTEHCAHIRAQAQALVRMARAQPDLQLALELESIAFSLLQSVHNLEMTLKPG
jgi:hypothetical protein